MLIVNFKLVRPKIKILSSFTSVVPNPFDFHSSSF